MTVDVELIPAENAAIFALERGFTLLGERLEQVEDHGTLNVVTLCGPQDRMRAFLAEFYGYGEA